MTEYPLKSIIESLLFVSGKPLKIKDFCRLLEKTPEEIKPALEELVAEKQNSGVVVLDNSGEYQLATNPANSTFVKNFLNAELREKLTDATVEVLGIIAYRQPISKAEIEAIRGVNSQYSVRHLLMRGLIEKTANPLDTRSFLYQTTTEFLQHLGLKSVKELPEFEKLVSQIRLPETQALENAGADERPNTPNTDSNKLPSQSAPDTQDNKTDIESDNEDYENDDEDEDDDDESVPEKDAT